MNRRVAVAALAGLMVPGVLAANAQTETQEATAKTAIIDALPIC